MGQVSSGIVEIVCIPASEDKKDVFTKELGKC
jgi:hypothetical protein